MWDASHSGDYEIVGIVEDAKYQDTRGPAYATFFLPLLQAAPGDPFRGWVGTIELHVAGKLENLEPAVRKTLADIDPNLTVLTMTSIRIPCSTAMLLTTETAMTMTYAASG